MSFCTNCGSQLTGQPKFCTFCGHPLTVTPPEQEVPAPAYEAPVPMYEAPAPMYEAPAPVFDVPAPAVEEPAPVFDVPAPAVEEPAPVMEAPAPVFDVPAPAVEEPAPVVEEPAPVYEAPAPVYEAPAPVYEAPAPVYEAPAPVYEAPAPVYEAPAPVYEAPAPVYEAPKPVYEAPAPTYKMPEPVHAAPAPVFDVPAPVAEKPAPPVKKPAPKQHTPKYAKPAKKGKAGLIVGIAVALIVVVLAVLFLPKLLGGSRYIGKYEATSVTFMGMTMSGSELGALGDFWIELKAADKCTMHLADEEASGTWKLDGEQISCTIEGETLTGKLKDGKLELAVAVEGVEMSFVFEKTESKNSEKTDTPNVETAGTEAPIDTLLPGYWTLLRADSADPSNAMTVEEVAHMRETLGTEVFLVLNEDGTGVGSFYSETRVTWGDDVLTMQDLGIKCMYTLEGNELTLVMDFDAGVKYVYVPGTGEAPELDMYVEDESDSEDLSDID